MSLRTSRTRHHLPVSCSSLLARAVEPQALVRSTRERGEGSKTLQSSAPLDTHAQLSSTLATAEQQSLRPSWHDDDVGRSSTSCRSVLPASDRVPPAGASSIRSCSASTRCCSGSSRAWGGAGAGTRRAAGVTLHSVLHAVNPQLEQAGATLARPTRKQHPRHPPRPPTPPTPRGDRLPRRRSLPAPRQRHRTRQDQPRPQRRQRLQPRPQPTAPRPRPRRCPRPCRTGRPRCARTTALAHCSPCVLAPQRGRNHLVGVPDVCPGDDVAPCPAEGRAHRVHIPWHQRGAQRVRRAARADAGGLLRARTDIATTVRRRAVCRLLCAAMRARRCINDVKCMK